MGHASPKSRDVGIGLELCDITIGRPGLCSFSRCVRKMSIKLVIADDHEVVRAGLRSLLRNTEFEIVGEAGCGDEAVQVALRTSPDVVLLDVRMPEHNGFRALRRIRSGNPRLPVVMMSAHENPRFLALAYAGGAAGFVLKGGSRDSLIAALHDALEGRVTWKRRSLPNLGENEFREDESTEVEIALTPRENQVLVQLSEGQTNKQIAQKLDISYETVKEHVQHILQKIGVTDRTQAAVWAVRKGLA